MTRTLMMLTVLLLAPFWAIAADQAALPAWELVAAEAGLPATIELVLPAGIDIAEVDHVGVAGAEVRDTVALTTRAAVRFRLNEPPGGQLRFNRLTLNPGAGQSGIDTIPIEVHWLKQNRQPPLLVPYMETLHTTPMVLSVVVQNTSDSTLEVTDFRFLPLELSTGRLLLARDFEPVVEVPAFDMPYVPDGTLQLDRPGPDGPEFQEFNFQDGELQLAPGEQLLLIASADSSTRPDLFHHSMTTEWAPWLEYRHDGQEWQHVLIRTRSAD